MKIVHVKTYQYSELSDKAKEKAREWYLRGQDGSFEWESVQSDAEDVGLILEGENHGRMQGAFKSSAEDCALRVLKNHGETCETYKTAKEFLDSLTKTVAEEVAEEMEQEFLRSLLEDYRIMYEKEMEYQASEPVIAETMAVNEYDFLENGTRF